MTKKRIVLLIGIFVIVLCSVLLWLYRPPSSQTDFLTTPTPASIPTSTLPLPKAALPTSPPELPLVSYETSSISQINIPKEITNYETAGTQSVAASSTDIARLFGFSGAPQITETNRGQIYVWSSGLEGVLVGPGASHIDYAVPHPGSLPPLGFPDSDFISLARGLALGVSRGVAVSEPTIRYYTTSSDRIIYKPRGESQAIELVFYYLIDGLPLFIDQPQIAQITVRYDSTKKLRYFSSPIFRQSLKKTGTVALLSKEAVIQRIAGRSGILYQTVAPDDASEPDTKSYTFSSISVQKVEPGYYFDRAANTMVAVAIVRGLAKDSSTGKAVNTLTLIRTSL